MSRPFEPSSNVAHVTASMTSAMSAVARELRAEGRQIIDLGQGQPDFATPAFIRAAAERAIEGGATRYTATDGILPLREAVARQANDHWRGPEPFSAGTVVITSGAKQALFNACFVLFGAGDEVLIPTPNWTSYYQIVALAKATPVPVFGDVSRQYKVDVDALMAAATPRTRGVLINSPCNPTGAVYTPAEMAAIVALATERGWWLLSDEVYRRIAYEQPACSALDVAVDRDRLVIIDGVSKAFAMTGWRLGWVIAPRAVAAAMTSLQSHTTSNAPSPSQHAALAALDAGSLANDAVADMVRQLRARRDIAVAELGRRGDVEHVHPDGAFYLYVNVAKSGVPGPDAGATLARDLLARYGVVVVPGAGFMTPDWIRISYGGADADVLRGVRSVAEALHRFREPGSLRSHSELEVGGSA